MIEPIKVKCRVCGRAANANEFILDPVYKIMACPMCVRDRKNKSLIKKGVQEGAPAQGLPGQQAQASSQVPSSSQASSSTSGFQQSVPSAPKFSPGLASTKLSESDDKELEEMYKRKQERLQKEKESMQRVQKIYGEKVKYTCPKCKYAFVYSIVRKMPNKCPYCDTLVVKFVV